MLNSDGVVDFLIVGFSLEVLVMVYEGWVMMYLIVGIWWCGRIDDEDVFLEKELLVDDKECVEYLMLVDFG